LLERGAIMGGARRPQQARIDLMLALGMGLPVEGIRAVFAGV
jgi:L-asparaginase/Glu-tRNA(Gln) amidotransferase subunit D